MVKKYFLVVVIALLFTGCVYLNDVNERDPLLRIENQTQIEEPAPIVNASATTRGIEQNQEAENNIAEQPRQPLQQFRNSPEIPSEAERAALRECSGKQFTTLPVDLTNVYEIVPLGNLAPPGHTLPTEHTYMHFNAGGSSTELFTLYAPAEVYITSITRGTGFTQDPVDYTIYFALCKDVVGYYNHVKELSPQLAAIETSGNCRTNPGSTNYQYCENQLDRVAAGAEMGKVGRLQGNFDFGLIDLSKTNNFSNPSRYGLRSLHIQCPYDYYDTANREKFFALITRNDAKQCGEVMQDVTGTAQGNWFYGTSRADMGGDWGKYLSLVYDNKDPSLQVVSIGGIFTNAGTWKFTPTTSGVTNRNFAHVTSDDNIYCYEAADKQGKILIQLTSATELKIEKQIGSCSQSNAFQNSSSYSR